MIKHKNLHLDNQLCFALYSANNAIIRTYRNKLARIELTYPQYLVMLVLWNENGVPISTIANTLNLDSGTITPLVQRLEKTGFLSRRRSKDDERVVNVYLTIEGKDLEHKAARIQKEVASETGLNKKDFFSLRSALVTLTKTLINNYKKAA